VLVAEVLVAQVRELGVQGPARAQAVLALVAAGTDLRRRAAKAHHRRTPG
jgi:hypothetical protein